MSLAGLRPIAPLLLALCAASLIGCHDSEADLVGKWKIQLNSADAKGGAIAETVAQGLGNMTLDFRPNNVCSLVIGTQSIPGTYTISGKSVTVTESGSKRTTTFTLSDDNKTLTSAAIGVVPTTLVKESGS